MAGVEFAPAAEADFDAIADHIARADPTAAAKLITRMKRLAALIASRPRIGRPREDLRAGLRSFPVESYILFYRIVDDGIEVARVLHGRRDIDAVFRAESN
jgi:toxin ParE1/3/4